VYFDLENFKMERISNKLKLDDFSVFISLLERSVSVNNGIKTYYGLPL
jgi:hypothetical protein